MLPRSPRARDAVAVLLLLLLPITLLGECLFGGKHYLPFDRAEFPPVATMLEPGQIAALQENANYDATEPPIWFDPEMRLIHRGLNEGTYPHWNPYVRGGAPLVANGHVGVFDPLHWPAFLFADPADGLLYLTYAVLALAGLLMYGLLRELSLSRSAALFGSVAFALSGTLTANAHWYMRVEPIALLPGMFWALLRIDRAAGARRGLWAAAFSVLVAMAWTAGFPPFAVAATLFSGLFAAVLLLRRWRAQGGREAVRLAGWFGLGLALGLMLAAVQMLQMLEFYPHANRTPHQTLADQSVFAFDPMGLLGYLMPDVFSHPGSRVEAGSRSPLAFLLFSRTEWTTGDMLLPDRNYNFTEYAVFAGTLPLLFAFVGLLMRGPRWRFVGLAGLVTALLLAIGPAPLYYAHVLPGIESVPPFRFAALGCVFVSILAGLGFDRLWRGGAPRLLRAVAVTAAIAGLASLWTSHRLASDPAATERAWLEEITERYRPMARTFDPNLAPDFVTPELVHRFLFTAHAPDGEPIDRLPLARERLERNLDRAGYALLLAAAFAALLSLRRDRAMLWWLGIPAVALTTLELSAHGLTLNHGRELPYPLETPVHEYLRQRRDAAAADGGIMVARANPGGGEAMHMPPGSLAQERIRDLHFYTFLDGRSGLPMKELYGTGFLARDHFVHALPDDERLQLPWWDAMGLRFLLTTHPMVHAGAQVGPQLEGPGGQFFVYERTTALPRAWVVPELRTFEDDATMIAAAIGTDFAPRDHALVVAPDVFERSRRLPALPADPQCKQRRVEVTFENLKRLHLYVEAGAAGYLVVADTCLPGWTATIDGAEVPIHEANVYQRILPLPAKACDVEFVYRTPGLVSGGAISATALASLLALVWLALRRRPAATAAAGASADRS